MSECIPMKLKEAVFNCYELREQGRFNIQTLTALVMERYRDVVDREGDRLVAKQVSRIGKELIGKSMTANYMQESLFPKAIQHLQLPEAISLPPDDMDLDDETGEPEEGYTWIELPKASYAECRLHLRLLDTNIRRCQHRRSHIAELCDYLAPVLEGERENEAIGPVLQEMGQAVPVV